MKTITLYLEFSYPISINSYFYQVVVENKLTSCYVSSEPWKP